jgi:predicted kinase
MEKRQLQVIATVGIPSSGKSTWSKELVKNDPSFVRICRDDYRFMMKDLPVCDTKVEDIISKLVLTAIDLSLAKNLNVIIDQTNVKLKYIESLAEHVKYKANFSVKIFDITLEEAIERDNKREKKVGKDVIKRMYKDFRNLVDSNDPKVFETKLKEYKPKPIFIEKNTLLQDCVIIDVDNTLTFISNRSPFDWSKVGNDYPNQVVIDHVNIYKKLGYVVIIMSGRDEICMPETKKWLLDNNVSYDYLYMRKNNDFRKDSIVKKELYEQHIKNKFNVFVSLDDRSQVLDMYRGENLSVFQVNPSVD